MSPLSDKEVVAIFEKVSNWNRWGPDDEKASLNFITPAKVVQAAALVKKGRIISAAHDMPSHHVMIYRGEHAHGAGDQYTVGGHGMAGMGLNTHVDALTHMYFNHQTFNGKAVADVAFGDGLHYGSLYPQGAGIVTRGVLLDVARARGVAYIEADDTVTAADLDAAEKLAGVQVSSGDAVIVRAAVAQRDPLGGARSAERTGLGPDTLPWLHEREVSLFASDCPEKLPSDWPELGLVFHIGALVFMGMILLDWASVEELAAACVEEDRYEFMLNVAPPKVKEEPDSR